MNWTADKKKYINWRAKRASLLSCQLSSRYILFIYLYIYIFIYLYIYIFIYLCIYIFIYLYIYIFIYLYIYIFIYLYIYIFIYLYIYIFIYLASEASLSLVMSIELEIYYIYIFIYLYIYIYTYVSTWIYGKTERQINKTTMPDECNFGSVTYALKIEAWDLF